MNPSILVLVHAIDLESFLAYRSNGNSNLQAYKKASANANPPEPENENPPVVGGTLSAKEGASSTESGSGSSPTESGGAMGSLKPGWVGIAAGLFAWLI